MWFRVCRSGACLAASGGSYDFTDHETGAHHAGTFQAADGVWVMTGPWTDRTGVGAEIPDPYADGVSYRLIGADRPEFGGRFGTAVWTRLC